MTGWKAFVSTFLLVFVAELGDKTQVAGFSLAAENGMILSVFLGAALALICASLVAVLVGHRLALMLPKKLLKTISGLLFVGTGFFLLVRSLL